MWPLVLDLIVDRMQFLQHSKSDHGEPWRYVANVPMTGGNALVTVFVWHRIALQCMLVSCHAQPPLGVGYHVARWHCKIERKLNSFATDTSKFAMNFDADEEVSATHLAKLHRCLPTNSTEMPATLSSCSKIQRG